MTQPVTPQVGSTTLLYANIETAMDSSSYVLYALEAFHSCKLSAPIVAIFSPNADVSVMGEH